MEFIIPTLTFMIYLLSLLMIIRFIFSPDWLSWIFPLIINIIFVISQAYQSFALMKRESLQSELFSTFPPFISKANNVNTALFISILWLIMISLFYRAIKKNRKPRDKRREIMKSNYYGAQYTQQLEKNRIERIKKEREEEENFGFIKPEIYSNDEEWTDLFDDNKGKR